MKVLDEFKVFNAAKQLLTEVINCNILHDISLNTEDQYTFDGDDLRWEIEPESSEFNYSSEAGIIREFEDCEMFLVRSCTGEKYLAVFDKSNKVEG